MAKTAIRPPQAEAGAAHVDAVRLLSDTPLDGDDQDTLGRGAFAEALAELIDSERTDTPLTIAISAPWGAGKTSTARLIERRLRRWSAQRLGARPTIVCKFNAWLHSDASHLGASFAAAVARTVDSQRPWWRRLISPLPSAMIGAAARRRRVAAIAVLALIVAAAAMFVGAIRHLFTGTTGLSHDDAARLGPLAVAILAVMLLWRRLFSAAQAAARFIEAPAEEASHGEMAVVRQQLGTLIHEAIGDGRLVILIDDLERCKPDRALELCEVASQLLAQRGVVVVLIADMSSIADAAGARYPCQDGEEAEAGRRFLEKLVQIQIALPPARESDLELLLAGRAASVEVPVEPAAPAEPAAPKPRRLKALWRGLWRLGPRPLGVMFVVTVVLVVIAGNTNDGGLINALAEILFFGLPVLAISSAILRGRDRLRTRHRLRQIDDAIATVKDTAAPDDLEASVLEQVTPAARDARQVGQLVRQQVRSYLIHESEPLKEVEAFIRLYAPRLPRGAKRMLNHARVLTRVAVDRGVLSGADVTPQHLGKWIVFSERWVELAERVKEDPAAMAELEARARQGRLEDVSEPQQLMRLLQQPPELGPVVERLIRFEPAESPSTILERPPEAMAVDGDAG